MPQAINTPAVRFSPRRIGHANLFVGDIERSMQFYNAVCGFEEMFRERHIGAGFLSNGNTHHDLGLIQATDQSVTGIDGYVQISAGKGTRPGLNHLGWEMMSERALVEAYRRARIAGVAIHRTTDHQTVHSLYLFDPDHNMHELYADVVKDWRGVLTGDMPPVSGRWDPEAGEPLNETFYPKSFEPRAVPDALIHPLRFTHALLLTRQMAVMERFYCDVLGLEIAFRAADGGVVGLAGPAGAHGRDVVIARTDERDAAGLHHLSFEMADEAALTRAFSRLGSAEIAIERQVATAGKHSIMIRDPDRILCEFYVRRSGTLFARDPADPDTPAHLLA